VYARYWLHGKGPAPAGNMPVAVHFSPARAALPEAGAAVPVTLTVACGRVPARGRVELAAPGGITVEAPQDLSYDTASGDYAAWDLTVRAAPGAAPGRYFVTARIGDEHGQVIEDTLMVGVGERRWPDPELPAEEALEVMQEDFTASAGELELTAVTPELRLAPGGRGEIVLGLTSRLACEIHGEVQLLSPFGSWEMIPAPVQGFSLTPGEPAELRFAVCAPGTARPGARWWALAKVMYFGRVWYSRAVPVTIEAG
jgi:hypothetical protein